MYGILPSAFQNLSGKERMPSPFRQPDRPLRSVLQRQRTDQKTVSKQILRIDLCGALLLLIIHNKSAHRRTPGQIIFHICAVQIRQKTHPQRQISPAYLCIIFGILHPLIREILCGIHLLPRRIRDSPAVQKSLRREHNRLHTPQQILAAYTASDLRRPEKSAKARRSHSPDKIPVPVEIGIEKERIRRRQRAGRTNLGSRPLSMLPVQAIQQLLIQNADRVVHLLAVHSRRKACTVRKGPVRRIII